MIEADVRVIVDGESHSIRKFGLSDLVALERHFGISSATLGHDLRMEWVAFLIHRRLTRSGAIPSCAFDDDFIDRIDSIDFVQTEGVDEEVRPTDREALTAL